MSDKQFDGVVIMLALIFCGLLFAIHPPEDRKAESKQFDRQQPRAIRDDVTGVEVTGPAVIMITKAGCPPCERMKRETLPVAKDDGYEIHTRELPAKQYPTTRIFDGRRWTERVGFFRWSKPSRAEVKKYIESNAGSSPPKNWYRNGDPWRNLTAKEANKTFERVSE